MTAGAADIDALLRSARNPSGDRVAAAERESARRRLLEIGGPARRRIVEALESRPDGLDAPVLVELLGEFASPDDVPLLSRLLERGDELVAERAGRALALHPAPAAGTALEHALGSAQPAVLMAAADGALIRGDARLCDSVAERLDHADAATRYHLLRAAVGLGCVDLRRLDAMAREDPDPDVRSLASASLRTSDGSG